MSQDIFQLRKKHDIASTFGNGTVNKAEQYNNNNKRIPIATWLQVTMFKGADIKKIKKKIVEMLKVK